MKNNEVEEMLMKRRFDIEKVIEYKDSKNIIYDNQSQRDILLIYTVCLSYLDEESAKNLIKRISETIHNDSKNYLNMLLKKIHSFINFYDLTCRTRYSYSNSTILRALNITTEEIKKLDLQILVNDEIIEEREQKVIEEMLKKK